MNHAPTPSIDVYVEIETKVMRKQLILSFIMLVLLAFQAASPWLANVAASTGSAVIVQRIPPELRVSSLLSTANGSDVKDLMPQQLIEGGTFEVRDSLKTGEVSGLHHAPMEAVDEVIDGDAGDDSVLPKGGTGGIYFLVNSTLLILALGFIFSSATVRYHTRR